MADDDDFERQLQQEAAERERAEDDGVTGNAVNSDTTRVEDDGTVMEFDAEKRAWFPKVSTAVCSVVLYQQPWLNSLKILNPLIFNIFIVKFRIQAKNVILLRDPPTHPLTKLSPVFEICLLCKTPNTVCTYIVGCHWLKQSIRFGHTQFVLLSGMSYIKDI